MRFACEYTRMQSACKVRERQGPFNRAHPGAPWRAEVRTLALQGAPKGARRRALARPRAHLVPSWTAKWPPGGHRVPPSAAKCRRRPNFSRLKLGLRRHLAALGATLDRQVATRVATWGPHGRHMGARCALNVHPVYT